MSDKPDKPRRGKMKLDDKVKAEDLLYANMFQKGDNKTMAIGLLIAIVLHVLVLISPLPDMKSKLQQKKKDNVVYVRKYVPPPPKIQQRQIVRKKLTRKVPIPDPTPDEPEPIREPEPEIDDNPIPPDVEVLIGDPEPPPPTGPLVAGVGDVTEPVRLSESYIEPVYPELARRARISTKVILQAVVLKDGTVSEVEVLLCKNPGMGFEEAAIDAVRQWRYEPATQNGKPVDVFFQINIDFNLQ